MPEPTDANGRTLPGWARSVSYLIGTVGFSVVVALVLLAALLGYVQSPVTETLAVVRDHAQQTHELPRLLRQICRNTAKSEAERVSCDARAEYPR